MNITVAQLKDSLKGTNRGGDLSDVVNIHDLFGRASNTMLAKVDPVETIRLKELSQFVHDDLQNYSLADDYKKIIDIANVEDRQSTDRASRIFAEPFASSLNSRNKRITIEAREGVKFIRINWKGKSAVTLHNMDSLTANGTIAAVGSASGLKINTQYKLSGSGSVEFDLTASGDGVQGTGFSALDLESWDETADVIVPVYLSSADDITSLTFIFGNDLTANYWTFSAQTTQSDGATLRAGWNKFLFPWRTATETGTVDPATIDSFKLTFAASAALSNIRVDNILVSLGRIFDHKYYSQYLFKNSEGTWIKQPTDDNDTIVLTGTALQIFILECQVAVYQQLAVDANDFRYTFAKRELNDLYQQYKAEHPSEAKKQVGSYWGAPKYGR